MRLLLWSIVPLLLGGCSLGFNYQQCSEVGPVGDAECAAFDSQQPYCTGDGLCVQDPTPEYLCPERYPADLPPEALAIGAMFNLAPDSLDNARVVALKLGLDEVAEQARFNKSIRPIAAVICYTDRARSDGNRPKDLARMLDYLTNTKTALGIVGPTTSEDAKTVIPLASSTYQIPIISPSADSARLADVQTMPTFFFRTAPSDSAQAQALAQSTADFPTNSAGMPVYLTLASVQTEYGNNVRQAFQNKWSDRNQANVPTATPSFPESADARDKVVAAGDTMLAAVPTPTIILLVLSRQAQPFALTLLEKIKDLKSYTMGTTPTKLYFTDGALAPNLLPLALDMNYAKIFGTSLQNTNLQGIAPQALDKSGGMGRLTQSATEFVANMKQKGIVIAPETGTYDVFIGYTYDAFYALAMAIESLRGSDAGRSQVALALRNIKSTVANKQYAIGPGSFGSFVVGVSSLQSGGEVALGGVTGPLRFTAQGDREPALFERWKVEKVPATMMPEMPETSKFNFTTF